MSDSSCDSQRPRSVNQILRDHPRERLFVPTIRWTSRHLELLDCTFRDDGGDDDAEGGDKSSVTDRIAGATTDEPVTTQPLDDHSDSLCSTTPAHTPDTQTPAVSRSEIDPELGSYLETQAKIFNTGSWNLRPRALERLLTASAGRFTPVCCDFRFTFGGRRVDNVEATFLLRRCPYDGTLGPPLIAYIEDHEVEFLRLKNLRIPRRDECVSRISSIKLSAITPRDRLRDPYIVALLIAMAQSLRRRHVRISCAAQDREARYPVHFLYCPSDRRDEYPPSAIHLYSADVSARFLDKLDCPNQAPAGDAGLVVRRRDIPTTPHARLGRAIYALTESIAAADDEAVQAMRAAARKRKLAVGVDGGGPAATRVKTEGV